LQLQFWNQGLAPILALISPKEVQVYSSLAPPSSPRRRRECPRPPRPDARPG
jgi:hypothetical protein